jgi:transcriptional regulator with XRE-family HTH domain
MPRSQRDTAMAETPSWLAKSVWLRLRRLRSFSIRVAHEGLAILVAARTFVLDTLNLPVINFFPGIYVTSQGESALVSANNNKQSQFKRYQLYRGLYSRVARKLGVDRSYVSRVARGERQSKDIEDALASELKRIERG